MLKKYIKKIFPLPFRIYIGSKIYGRCRGPSIVSYAQEGEDIILNRIFEKKYNGFYVDVGAHHPVRFSNTHLLYKKGWSGINIDATPGSMDCFDKKRKNDVNLEVGVGLNEGELTYYMFNDPALNSFSKDLSTDRNNRGSSYRIVKEVAVPVKKLSTILREYIDADKHIDLLTIDAEGMDLEVLESNDWSVYRPDYVLVETLGATLTDILAGDIYKYLINY